MIFYVTIKYCVVIIYLTFIKFLVLFISVSLHKNYKIMNRRLDCNGKNYIVCAAIWYNDGKEYIHQPFNIKSGFVICGHRHHNCFATAYTLNGSEKITGLEEVQGFITSGNEFVNREEAAIIAFNADQTKNLCQKLFSEDIY